VTASSTVSGGLQLRPAPIGLPDVGLNPPVVAESGDPFAAARVLHLLARIERGRAARIVDLVDRLNGLYLDWRFSIPVVTDVALQLAANWMADYRNASGIVVEDGEQGPTVTIEDSTRVDPWIVRQVSREVAACEERLRAFSRRDREALDG
jgi:hypothetical protein